MIKKLFYGIYKIKCLKNNLQAIVDMLVHCVGSLNKSFCQEVEDLTTLSDSGTGRLLLIINYIRNNN